MFSNCVILVKLLNLYVSGFLVLYNEDKYVCLRKSSTCTKIRRMERRLVWPLRENDMQIREVFRIC